MLVDSFLNKAVHSLQEGKIIMYPSETVWGMGCDPYSKSSVMKIARLKERSIDSKPFILLVSNEEMLLEVVACTHPRISTLLNLHERPLTVVYPAHKDLPNYLSAKDGTVAVRQVKETTVLQLIESYGKPLISTSANLKGESATDDLDSISESLKLAVDYIYEPPCYDLTGVPSIIAKYNEKGLLDFIRE